jgi:hypothetical protein
MEPSVDRAEPFAKDVTRSRARCCIMRGNSGDCMVISGGIGLAMYNVSLASVFS